MSVLDEPSSSETFEQQVIMSRDLVSIVKGNEDLKNDESDKRSSPMDIVHIFTINEEELHSNIEIEEENEQTMNKSDPNKVSYWYVLTIIVVLGYSTVFLSPQLLIPRHNIIYYPNIWHKTIFCSLAAIFAVCMRMLLELSVFTKEKSLIEITMIVRWFLCLTSIYMILMYFSTFVWTTYLEFHLPIPFCGLLTNVLVWLIGDCCLWSMVVFPSELKNKDEFRRKINRYLIYDMWWYFINFQRDILSFGFKAISGELQFIFALLIPVVKEMNKRILGRLVMRIVEKEDETANVLVSVRLNIHYALFVAIRMNGAEVRTVFFILMVDFLLQLWMARQIIKIDQKVQSEIEKTDAMKNIRAKAIMKLLLAETIEGLVPIAYAIGFAMAYYGPNGNLTGNVLSDIWAYKKVDNVGRLFAIQFILFGIDSLSVMINTFVLSKFGSVNLKEEFCEAMKKYWLFLTIQLGNTLTVYFGHNDISMGTDMTMKFSWISTTGRLRFIYNATDLNHDEKAVLLANNNF